MKTQSMLIPKNPVRFTVVAALVCCAVSWFESTTMAARPDFLEQEILALSDPQVSDQYARDVAISGDVLLIGARGRDDAGSSAGATYVYRHDGTTWMLEQTLLPTSTEFAESGTAVAIDGAVACVATPRGDNGGTTWVYRYDGSSWLLEATLHGDTGGMDDFGFDVAIDGSRIVVGARQDATVGAAYVYSYDGSNWALEQKLISDAPLNARFFGAAVDVDGDFIVVGESRGLSDGTASGIGYFFRHDGSTWNLEQKVTPAFGIRDFGAAAAISGGLAIFGAPSRGFGNGTAHAYAFDGLLWAEEAVLTASDGELFDHFGASVALGDGVAFVGAPQDMVAKPGKAYRFRYDGTSWNEAQILAASDGFDLEAFGFAIATDGDIAVIGRPFGDFGTGMAHLYFSASCLVGSVNAGAGSVENVLFVNGSSGGADRHTTVFAEAETFFLSVLAPSAGGPGKYVIHANDTEPAPYAEVVLPSSIGTTCFPLLLSGGASPVVVANNLGKEGQVGASAFFGSPMDDPERADAILAFPGTVPVGTVLTFQGAILDPASPSPKGASVTNGVVAIFE